MRRILFLIAVVCAATTLFSSLAKADNNILMRVDESSTRLFLREKSSEIEFVLESRGRAQTAKILLEIVSPDDTVRTKTEREVELKKGTNRLTLPLELTEANLSGGDLLWHRLRYQILPLKENGQTVSGVVSLSEITPDLFEVRVAAADDSMEGSRYGVRVRAAHPLTNRGAKDVRISATLELELKDNENENNEDDEIKLTANAKTDGEGFAVLNFDIPADRKVESGEIKIRAGRGGVIKEEDEEIDFDENQSKVYISTDKPLYQPGQTLNIRGLFLNRLHRVVSNAPLNVEIEDPEGETVYRAELTTSRFGVASLSWQIAENTKLGDYRIRIEEDDDNDVGYHVIKISRYDLPNFTVAAKPNQAYYLPNQNAEIEIRADYLFGKPVTNAKVRLVRETEREWNYREQKWETEEAEKFEGTLDAEGKFIARVDLSEHHKDLAESGWMRSEDLRFAAYITDASTNKTEQRRFDVRLSKEAVHVYLVGETYRQNPKLPVRFYVTTFYADGTPAACDVEIRDNQPENEPAQPLAQTKSNQYGAAKIEFHTPSGAEQNNLNLKIAARDAKGQTGTHEEEMYLDADESVLRVETNKTIYRRGEPVKVEIVSTVPDALVYVDVMRGWSVLRSQAVKIKDGRGSLKIPYSADLRNDLTIAAYAEIPDDENNSYYDDDLVKAARTIIYPAKRELQLDVKMSEAVYRPGDEAKVDFNVAKANGGREESALGVVVFDKAVEERARTDSEFGGGYSLSGNYYGLLYGRSFGTLSRSDLDKLDMRRPVSPELELAAEILLRDENYFSPNFFGGDFDRRNAGSVFGGVIEKQLRPVREKLQARYDKTYEHPVDEAALRRILRESGIDFDAMRDPWGLPYRAEFKINRDSNVLELTSAGADKKAGTSDDFTAFSQSWNYFKQIGDKINPAVAEHHQRTGGFIRDAETLQNELRGQNVALENLRDRWNKPYRVEFGVDRTEFLISLVSCGANGQFEKAGAGGDDFTVWTSRINYFASIKDKLETFLSSHLTDNKPYPKDEAEFKNITRQAGVEFDVLRDGWNRPFYLTTKTHSRFSDRVKIESVAKYGEKPQEKLNSTPVAQGFVTFKIRSAGADGQQATTDDFDAAVFTGIITEQTRTDGKSEPVSQQTYVSRGRGAITGVITDQNGAVVPSAAVIATNEITSENFEAQSDEEGRFLLKNLPSGLYKVEANAPHFRRTLFESVPVRSANLTTVDFILEVAGVSSVVEVTAGESVMVDATETKVQENRQSLLSPQLQQQIATPRLREYFPETLVWQPELITDKNGKAELKFKLADSLTTWKMAVIGSTVDGEIGLVEKEFQAFMPFFAEHDPPKILTEGDKIALPVVLRNYLDKPQNVTATMASSDWFRLLTNPTQKVEVAPNASSSAIFNFEAIASVKEGKQRVTAIGGDAGDAIEKPVTVHPNGREISKTQGTVFRESAVFDVDFPADALPRTRKAELKIYPNLMSHVVESVEGILQRPYGCGEQTISSTYPSLLILKATKNGADSNLKIQARRYLKLGYERLVGYKGTGGGFTYWGSGEADLALTAYALRFLTDAADFIDVDKDLINETRDWLLKQQLADGSWSSSLNLTAYISRTLTRLEKSEKSNAALNNALAYLQKESAKIEEPYILANTALALFNSGNEKTASEIAGKLHGLAKTDNTGAFWTLETNTPFNGWGSAGRIEATALVLQVLVKAQNSKYEPEIQKGLQFLFKQKDRYGVWHSTQTTINVLDTLIMMTGGNGNGNQSRAEIFVNGQKAREIALPASVELSYPLTVDLTAFLNQPHNRVEIRQINGGNAASAQIVQNYYVAWSGENNFLSNNLRLAVNYDKTSAEIGEEISCRVEIERTDNRGYGMLLAEIGLPPGADVNRESLAKAVQRGYGISRYDILPDKVIVYMWAQQAGGTKFDFTFKPRYGIEANTAPSVAYDYYNPESQATLAPVKFSVR